MANVSSILDALTLLRQAAAIPAPHGQLDVQNINGVVCVVDDEGNAIAIGGGASFATVNIDQLPATKGLAFLSETGYALPCNNLDPWAAIPAFAVDATGRAFGPGEIVELPFTTVGGAPLPGQPVWVASAYDDSQTGAGKLTARRPNGSPGTAATVVLGTWPQNPSLVGVCLDASNYASAKTASVLFQPGGIQATDAPSDRAFFGSQLTGFSATKYYDYASGTSARFGMQVGHSMVLHFTVDQNYTVATQNTIVTNWDSVTSKGWSFYISGGGGTFIYSTGRGVGSIPVAQLRNGVNVLVVSVSSDAIRINLNGTYVDEDTTVTIDAPTGGSVFTLGNNFNHTQMNQFGGIACVAFLRRSLDRGEMQTIASGGRLIPGQATTVVQPFTQEPTESRALLHPIVIGDAACDLWYQAYPYNGLTMFAGLGGDGVNVNMTSHGTPGPVFTDLNTQTHRNVAPLIVDSMQPVVTDSRGFPRCSAGSRIEFTVSTLSEVFETMVGYVSLDTTNGDNGAVTWAVNGVAQNVIGGGGAPSFIQSDGRVFYSCLGDYVGTVATAGSYRVEIFTPDRVPYSGTYMSGAIVVDVVTSPDAVFSSDGSATDLLIVVGGTDMCGHDQNVPGSWYHGATQLVRNLWRTAKGSTGRTVFAGAASFGVAQALEFGENNIRAWVNEIEKVGLRSGATNVTVLGVLGIDDYRTSAITAAAFGTAYGSMWTQLHARRPTWTLKAGKIIQAHYDAVANSLGNTVANYNAQIDALASSYLSILNLRTPTTLTFDATFLLPLYPGGQTDLSTNIKTAMGF